MDNAPEMMVTELTESGAEENSRMELIAKMAAQVLTRHYPNHMWAIGWAPGYTLVIKNLAIQDGRYGYTVDVAKAATTSEIEHAVMLGGGELLERCGVRRGHWDGNWLNLESTKK